MDFSWIPLIRLCISSQDIYIGEKRDGRFYDMVYMKYIHISKFFSSFAEGLNLFGRIVFWLSLFFFCYFLVLYRLGGSLDFFLRMRLFMIPSLRIRGGDIFLDGRHFFDKQTFWGVLGDQTDGVGGNF